MESAPVPERRWSDFRPQRFNQGQGRGTRNGLIYLGYPFGMRDGERTAVAPGHRFKVHCTLPRPWKDADDARALRRALVASWWLLGHFGALGSRSRRGFGSVALTGWNVAGGDPADAWPELDELPLTATIADPVAARRALDEGLARIRLWFGSEWSGAGRDGRPRHPHLGERARLSLIAASFAPDAWDQALAAAGARMQDFRLRRAPDYELVKNHLLAVKRQGGRFMSRAPDRVSFGLPLTFRFSSVSGPPVNLVAHDAKGGGQFERHGSLLHLRLLPVGERLHPLFVRLDGAVPGQDPPAKVRNAGRPLEPFATNAMDQFMDSLTGGQGRG